MDARAPSPLNVTATTPVAVRIGTAMQPGWGVRRTTGLALVVSRKAIAVSGDLRTTPVVAAGDGWVTCSPLACAVAIAENSAQDFCGVTVTVPHER